MLLFDSLPVRTVFVIMMHISVLRRVLWRVSVIFCHFGDSPGQKYITPTQKHVAFRVSVVLDGVRRGLRSGFPILAGEVFVGQAFAGDL
jgi:hypothetical protein